MNTIGIFLASSEELLEDRRAFENFLYRKSIAWMNEKGIFIELKIWENFIDAMSKTRLQDEYNKAIEECDIFVMLFWTKVGKYTDEEFEIAKIQFKHNGKPLIYTYFKDGSNHFPVEESLLLFREKLKKLDHFETPYKNTEGLLLHFSGQLDGLYNAKYLNHDVKEITEKIDKRQVLNLIDKGDLFEALEELNKEFMGKNIRLNALTDEFVNPPNNYNPVQFVTRLKVFVTRN